MRFLRIKLQILFSGFILLLPTLPSAAESVEIRVQSSPLAGSQYYAMREIWAEIKLGDRLMLSREADNRHDRQAIRVDWNGRKIGYVPRAENRAVAAALDSGEKLEARVSKLRSPAETADPWLRVEFEVFLIL